MKKTVVALTAFLLSAALCGCAQTPNGSVAELTRCAWKGEPEGGGRVCLRFSGDKAALTLENGGEQQEIAGIYVADETDLVIFDRTCARCYAFSYVPKGSALDLTYQGSTLTLQAENGSG